MHENLLSEEEIREVIETVEQNPIYRHPDVINFGEERTTIYKVTPINGIILIKGDSHTGFQHIHERHEFWSEKYYWKQEEDNFKFDNPSKFSPHSIPIIDYVKIADALYLESNLNLYNNKRPDVFEMFSGEVESNGKTKYHMLIYKGTKIVHTIYPHTKKHNKGIHVNYRRGVPRGKFWLNPAISTISVPYYNDKDVVVYSFQVMRDFEKNIETGVIINHVIEKTAIIYEREIGKIEEFKIELEMMRNADLSKVEKIIKELEDKSK